MVPHPDPGEGMSYYFFSLYKLWLVAVGIQYRLFLQNVPHYQVRQAVGDSKRRSRVSTTGYFRNHNNTSSSWESIICREYKSTFTVDAGIWTQPTFCYHSWLLLLRFQGFWRRRKEVGRVRNSKINVNASAKCDVIPNHWARLLFGSLFRACATVLAGDEINVRKYEVRAAAAGEWFMIGEQTRDLSRGLPWYINRYIY